MLNEYEEFADVKLVISMVNVKFRIFMLNLVMLHCFSLVGMLVTFVCLLGTSRSVLVYRVN